MRFFDTTQVHGLLVTTDASQSLDEIATKMLGAENFAVSKSLLPYTLLVKNNTGHYIWGLTVIYKFPDKIAPAGLPWSAVNRMTAGGPFDQRLMIAPGDSYLVTPVDEMCAYQSASGEVLPPPLADQGTEWYIRDFTEKFLDGTVEAYLDAIVFGNGSLFGHDEGELLSTTNASISAEKDLVTAVSSLHGDRLKVQLASPRASTTLTKHQEVYDQHLKSRSTELSLILEKFGEVKLKQSVAASSYGRWFTNSDFIVKGENHA